MFTSFVLTPIVIATFSFFNFLIDYKNSRVVRTEPLVVGFSVFFLIFKESLGPHDLSLIMIVDTG